MADQAIGLFSSYLRQARTTMVKPYLTAPILDIGCSNGYLSHNFNSGTYTGADIDNESITAARKIHPEHSFCLMNEIPVEMQFKTIVLLAVIEHAPDASALIKDLSRKLTPNGTIVITTPHPSFQRFYELGARIGFFSRTAAHEHHQYIDLMSMTDIIRKSNLTVTTYRRFLYGANQLFILSN